MKLRTLCACLIWALLFSGATFGEIITDPGSTGSNTSVSVSAGPGNPSPDSEYEDVWYSEYTTVAGKFHWEIFAQAYAECWGNVDGGWVDTLADASGAAASPYDVVSVDAYASVSSSTTDIDDPPDDTSSGDDCFDAYEAVSGMCDSFAWAAVEEGSDSTAHAEANSTGFATMY